MQRTQGMQVAQKFKECKKFEDCQDCRSYQDLEECKKNSKKAKLSRNATVAEKQRMQTNFRNPKDAIMETIQKMRKL